MRRLLFWSVLGTVILYAIPLGRLVAWPLVLLASFVHELGHGLAAASVGAKFQSLQVFLDASGVAKHSGSARAVGRAWIAMGGLIGPAIGGAMGMFFARTPGRARVCWIGLALGMSVLSVTVLQGLTTFVFAGALVGLAGWMAVRASPEVRQGAVAFLATQLALSVLSNADYLFTDSAHTGAGVMPSDVAVMAEALGGPYWVWGGVCGLVSVVIAVAGTWYACRTPRPPGSSRNTLRRRVSK